MKNLIIEHVKGAKVTGFKQRVPTPKRPAPDERHVLAVTVKCYADAIVALGAKAFPAAALEPYGIDILHPDNCIH